MIENMQMVETEFSILFRGVPLHGTVIAHPNHPVPCVLLLHGGGTSTTSQSTRYLRLDLAAHGIATAVCSNDAEPSGAPIAS